MYTLFIDTHGEVITISFIRDEEIFTKEEISEHSHSVYLLPLLDRMLKEKNIKLQDFNKVIVTNGPGSFTGVRIGLSVAKTIAYSLNIPIYVISSLEAYLISNDIKNNCIVYIEDPKGYYISGYDINGNRVEETYLENLDNYNTFTILNNKLDMKKIIDYIKTIDASNVFTIKANYIKKIEALNDKKN